MTSRKGIMLFTILVFALSALVLIPVLSACSPSGDGTTTTVTVTTTKTVTGGDDEPYSVENPFILKHNSHWVPGSSGEYWEPILFNQYVEYVTGGEVIVEMYPGGALGSLSDNWDMTKTGVTDMAFIWTPIHVAELPLCTLFSIPGLADNQSVMNSVQIELYDKYPEFEAQYAPRKWIGNIAAMRSDLHSVDEPILSLDDLKGKVFACSTESMAQVMRDLGGEGTVIVGADAYSAAQTGAVDGIACPWGYFDEWKMDEVTTYHTNVGLSPGLCSWIMNMDSFNKLKPAHQAAIEKFQYEGIYNLIRSNIIQVNNSYDRIPAENIFNFSDADTAELKGMLTPYWDDWADDMDALGLPGTEILADAIMYIDRYHFF
ncbi:TRAP transporter substrate-binding protein DctP [Chloroflexota bacterium]